MRRLEMDWGMLGAAFYIFLVVLGIVYILSPLIIMSRLGELISLNKEILYELRRANPLTKKL